MTAESLVLPASWKVLLVDDEPDVIEISRLILAGLDFDGRPVELLAAASAAEARELLARDREVALALIDVVMETDAAGLDLVRHIREQLRDPDMQLVLRTGQPGMAPEGEIVPRYEVNGYVVKTEITAHRLQSIVIAGLRGYRHARRLRLGGARPAPPAEPHDSALAAALLGATQRGEVAWQVRPEVQLASGRISGIELVPAWPSPRGWLPAARVGERIGDAAARRPLALWLLDHACRWARAWQPLAGLPLVLSLPLAGEGLADPALCEALIAAVHAARLPPGTIDLLVGEATLYGGPPGLPAAADALRAHGITLTLLDFGARTISPQQFGGLQPDRLKLHAPAVRGAAAEPQRAAVARSLIALAQTLKVVVIADGIAGDADAQFFRWEGCEVGQGDGLLPACPPDAVAGLLARGGG